MIQWSYNSKFNTDKSIHYVCIHYILVYCSTFILVLWIIFKSTIIYKKVGKWVKLYSKYRVDPVVCNGCLKFEFNDKVLYTKKNCDQYQVCQSKLLNIVYDIVSIKAIFFLPLVV